MVNIMPLTINQLEQNSKLPVLVRNNGVEHDRRGDLMFVMETETGKPISVTVPMTFLGINLSERFSRKLVIRSDNFRKAVYSGLLVLLTQKEFDDLERTPGASEERVRLQREAIGTATVENSASVKDELQGLSVNPTVANAMLQLEEGTSEVKVLNSLRTMANLIKGDERKYIMVKAKKAKAKNIWEFAKAIEG